MQITHHKPVVRGVSQLMYVGDSEAVETATSVPTSVKIGIAIALAWLILRKR